MRIGIDAMGGDKAPEAQVAGALAARPLLQDDDRIVLVGDEQAIRRRLAGADAADWEQFIEIRHAGEVIGMDESPVEALRAKPDSSIAVMAKMHADGEMGACISAGNTGACVAAAQMRLRRLRGVHRPGICVVVPVHSGPVAVCDVGANVNCRPQHLYQYGVMASEYVRAVWDVRGPRVGLLSIGQEDAKGNELVKQTRKLLKEAPAVNFIGNVEGRDLFSGACDVMVCDGFVGNVVLKLVEGMAVGVIRAALTDLAGALPDQAETVRQVAQAVMRKYDFNEYGGAPLLGVAGIFFICHGASDHRAVKNAVRGATEFARHRLNQHLVELLS